MHSGSRGEATLICVVNVPASATAGATPFQCRRSPIPYPQRRFGHSTDLRDRGPQARENVSPYLDGIIDAMNYKNANVITRHRQDSFPPGCDRDSRLWEAEIALGEVARLIADSVGRVDALAFRPDLAQPILECGHRMFQPIRSAITVAGIPA